MKGYAGRVPRDIRRQLDGLADDTLRKRIEGEIALVDRLLRQKPKDKRKLYAHRRACGVNAPAEGEGIHGRGHHHRRRSRKERVFGAWRHGGRGRSAPEVAIRAQPPGSLPVATEPNGCSNHYGCSNHSRVNDNNSLGARERSTPVPSPPPLAPVKAFSRSGCGRIFSLYWRVMREGLSTGPGTKRPGSGLLGPIFSGPDDCASLVQSL
jgi:hypothetical protein